MTLFEDLERAKNVAEIDGDTMLAELLDTAGAIIRSYRDRLHAANEQALEYQQQISELRGLLAQANADVRYLQGDHLYSNGKRP